MQGLYPIYKPRKNKENRRMNDIRESIYPRFLYRPSDEGARSVRKNRRQILSCTYRANEVNNTFVIWLLGHFLLCSKRCVCLQMLPFTLPLSFLVSLHVYTRYAFLFQRTLPIPFYLHLNQLMDIPAKTYRSVKSVLPSPSAWKDNTLFSGHLNNQSACAMTWKQAQAYNNLLILLYIR